MVLVLQFLTFSSHAAAGALVLRWRTTEQRHMRLLPETETNFQFHPAQPRVDEDDEEKR